MRLFVGCSWVYVANGRSGVDHLRRSCPLLSLRRNILGCKCEFEEVDGWVRFQGHDLVASLAARAEVEGPPTQLAFGAIAVLYEKSRLVAF